MAIPRTIIVTGGGTGGHIYPALAVADEMRRRGWVVKYVGTRLGLESRLASEAGFPFEALNAKPFRRSRDLQNIKALYSHVEGFVDACGLITAEKPHVVFGTGGYAAVPVCAAAGIMRIPLYLHEQNVIPGRANRLLALIAKTVFSAWPLEGAVPCRRKWRVIGMPLRRDFGSVERSSARKQLGISPGETVLLVFGGSRGAKSLNVAVSQMLSELKDITVIWATGEADFESLRAGLGRDSPKHRLLPYISDMPAVMAAADLAVTRAGAMTLAELSAAGLPAILVPYPYAMNDHQAANARNWVSSGAGTLVDDQDLKPKLYDAVRCALDDRRGLAEMTSASKRLARMGVAADIADALERGSRTK